MKSLQKNHLRIFDKKALLAILVETKIDHLQGGCSHNRANDYFEESVHTAPGAGEG